MIVYLRCVFFSAWLSLFRIHAEADRLELSQRCIYQSRAPGKLNQIPILVAAHLNMGDVIKYVILETDKNKAGSISTLEDV